MNLTRNILNNLLFSRLREKEKGVYSVVSDIRFNRNPDEYVLSVAFDTAPENVDRLTAAVNDELRKIAKGSLEDSVFLNAVVVTASEVSRDLNNPAYLNTYITDQLRNGSISPDGLKREEILKKITKEDVINLIRDSLNTEQYILLKLL